jgi:hypothetical protein
MKKLTNLVIRAVGLVDRGANQEAKMALVKRAEPDPGSAGTGGQVLKIVFKEPSHG